MMKNHKDYLKQLGWFNTVNGTVNMQKKLSCSLMHPLDNEFLILMHSYTHNTSLLSATYLHSNMNVRLILHRWMCVIWHELLYHSGAKSINSQEAPEFLQYMRVFLYLVIYTWKYNKYICRKS